LQAENNSVKTIFILKEFYWNLFFPNSAFNYLRHELLWYHAGSFVGCLVRSFVTICDFSKNWFHELK